MRRALLALLSIALATAAPAAAAAAAKAPLTPEDVIARVAAANAKLTAWSCTFLERRLFVHFNETETKEGRIRLKRGHGLRIDLAGKDEETIVIRKDEARQWRPRTKQMHVYRLDRADGGKRDLSPVPFAFGDASWDPARDNELRLLDEVDGEIALEMKPRVAGSAYVRKVLWIDPATWLPTRIQLTEATDDTINFVFSGSVVNPPLDDAMFQLATPAGAEVVEHKDLPSF